MAMLVRAHDVALTNHESPITNHQSRITNHESLITNSWSLIRNDMFPLARIRSRYDCDYRLGVARVEHLVRHAGLDEDEVAGRVLHRQREPRTVLVAHAALEDIQHYLEADVDVGGGDAAGRD